MSERTALAGAIRHLEGCSSSWVETIPVTEMFNGETVWQGAVQTFDLIDHPTATRCYAWSTETEGGKRRFTVVLHKPPVDSPAEAVRAAIVAGHRREME